MIRLLIVLRAEDKYRRKTAARGRNQAEAAKTMKFYDSDTDLDVQY